MTRRLTRMVELDLMNQAQLNVFMRLVAEERAKGSALPEAYRRAWPRFFAAEAEYERQQERGWRALNGERSAGRWALRIASLFSRRAPSS
jgi:hypothetical protein